ncbi:MAG TPA: RIP metalloprotease RseP [Bacteriovoracaceae bacterium]|nr:RIP metalloprotease RseP [Bacteriovoracaceae bacterium]
MLEKILIFVIFLGPLIFFHELGHFFFARLFGVRVEVFSIGFGPKIFKYKKKDTEYAISAIPLGGYVKMFGDDPFSEVELSPEEKKVAFNHKSKWARFWIVFGGPLANLILAYFLYVGLLAGGEKVPESRVGVVTEQSVLYEKGLRSGDVLVGINDEKVISFDDLNIKSSKVETITVERSGETHELQVDMGLEPFITSFMQVLTPMKRPLFIDENGEKFYLSYSSDNPKTDLSVDELAQAYKPGTAYLYHYVLEGDELIVNEEPHVVELTQENFLDALREAKLYPVDLQISNVVMGSAADKAGLKKGDILISLNGENIARFEDLRGKLQESPQGEPVKLVIKTSQGFEEKSITPEVKEINGQKLALIGIESSVQFLRPRLITAKAESFGAAVSGAFTRTWDGMVKTVSGYKKLVTREVSLNNIGGPLAIGKVASDSFNVSLSMFFRLMAIISINLGIINLFPIPVLDGGHIMFLVFETINGGPLSRKKLELAQKFGLSVLFLLIFVAIFNDLSRLF